MAYDKTKVAVKCEERGWSYKNLAKQLGVSESYAHMLISGERRPSAHLLISLAELFDCEASEVWEG